MDEYMDDLEIEFKDDFLYEECNSVPIFLRRKEKSKKKITVQLYLILLEWLHEIGLHIQDSDLRGMDERLFKVKQQVNSGSRSQVDKALNSLVWNYTTLIIDELELIREDWCPELLKEYVETM